MKEGEKFPADNHRERDMTVPWEMVPFVRKIFLIFIRPISM